MPSAYGPIVYVRCVSELEVVRYHDATAFLATAGEYLAAREAEHNVILGISARLRSNPLLYGSAPYFAVAAKGEAVAGVALRTPPHNLLLSELVDQRALDVLVSDVVEVFPDLPGVLGPKDVSRRFVELWQNATGIQGQQGTAQRAFRCTKVVPPAPTPGTLRRAAEDRALLLEWTAAFMAEALPGAPPRPTEEAVDDMLSRSGLHGAYVWETDAPVSFAACGNPTPNGVRIGPVYTPPALRGRGYASALVASLTQLLLDGGSRFCFLFTDLANPTSNKIYQRIGYEPVTDVDEYRFDS